MPNCETIDIVDKANNIVGSTDVKNAHKQKLLHRVVGVFVFSPDGDLYIQTSNKYGKFDISAGGHVKKGESYDDAAQREMLEELKLVVPIEHVSTFLPKDARLGHYWAIYTATAPARWKFKKTKEVKSIKKVNLAEVISRFKNNPDLFTHGFINTMGELIRIKKYD